MASKLASPQTSVSVGIESGKPGDSPFTKESARLTNILIFDLDFFLDCKV